MGVKLEFKDNQGRKVTKDQFVKNIAKEAHKLGADEMRKRLSAIRCPVHGQAPSNIREKSGSSFGLEFTCCCEALKAKVESQLAR